MQHLQTDPAGNDDFRARGRSARAGLVVLVILAGAAFGRGCAKNTRAWESAGAAANVSPLRAPEFSRRPKTAAVVHLLYRVPAASRKTRAEKL